MWLQSARLGPLHVLADLADLAYVHRIVRERPTFDQLPKMLSVHCFVHNLEEPGLNLRLIPVTDGFHQQFTQGPVLEGQLSKHVKDLTAQRLAFFVEFFQEPVVNLAFPRVLRNKVPKMAHFGLADAMNAAETLFEPVRIPRMTIANTVPAMAIDVATRRPRLANATGGLSGPAVHPIAVKLVYDAYRLVCRGTGTPIIGCGGVQTWEDAAELILAGASAVQMGTALFADPRSPLRVARGLERWVRRQGAGSVGELVGGVAVG